MAAPWGAAPNGGYVSGSSARLAPEEASPVSAAAARAVAAEASLGRGYGSRQPPGGGGAPGAPLYYAPLGGASFGPGGLPPQPHVAKGAAAPLPYEPVDYIHAIDSEDEEEEWPGRATPHTARRRCTDPVWLVFFSICMCPLIYLLVVGVPGADVRRLVHFMDHHGYLCGVGNHTQRPYLFFCLTPDGNMLSLASPICKESCPTSNATSSECPMPEDGKLAYVKQPDYDTTQVGMEALCKPRSRTLTEQLFEGRRDVDTEAVNAWIQMAVRAWEPLFAAFVFSVFASYLYLYLMRFCASTLVWIGITLLSVMPLCMGLIFLECWHTGKFCLLVGKHMDDLLKVSGGVGMIMVGLLFACTLYRQANDIELAISCIEWSLKCIVETPSLMVHPLLTLLVRIAVLAVLFDVGMQVLSLFYKDEYTLDLSYQPLDIAIGSFFLLMLFWLMQLVAANSHFVVMYSTELWYFNGGLKKEGHTPRCLTFRALFTALRYHQGSMAMGAVVAGLAQPFRILLAAVTGLARMDENPIGQIVGACCCCFVIFYDSILAPMSRNAYMEVARSSRPFFQAGWHAQDIMDDDDTVHLLNGATWLFQVAGLGTIAGLGFLLTQFITVTGIPGYGNFLDPTKPNFVFNSFIESMFGGSISLFMAFPFMMIFDTVSDTILFCHTVERLWAVEDKVDVEDNWVDSVTGYLGELMGCSCSLRAKDIGFSSAPAIANGAVPEGDATAAVDGAAVLQGQVEEAAALMRAGAAASDRGGAGAGGGGGGRGRPGPGGGPADLGPSGGASAAGGYGAYSGDARGGYGGASYGGGGYGGAYGASSAWSAREARR